MASRSSASVRSAGLAQRDSAAAVTSSSVTGATLVCSSLRVIAAFSAAGLPGSDSARRSACSVSSSPTMENSSFASLVATVALVMFSADSRSDSSAKDALLTPRMLIAFRAYFGDYYRTGRRDSGRHRNASLAGHLELFQEPVHHPALPGLIGQRLAHDPAGQLGRQRPDLGPKRGESLLPLGLDLGLSGLGDAAGLRLGLL